MDAKKFGAFISERRKEQHMTQAGLAGKIGVTDKAVSLCNILKVFLNIHQLHL